MAKQPPKKRGGSKPFQPTEDQRRFVQIMVSMGVRREKIAEIVGVDPKTLRKHFGPQLEHGAIEANAKVAANLFKIATGTDKGAVTAAIFWLKTRARWSEPPRVVALKRIDEMTEEEILALLGGEPGSEELRALAAADPAGSA